MLVKNIIRINNFMIQDELKIKIIPNINKY